jgi:hypothetical protein
MPRIVSCAALPGNDDNGPIAAAPELGLAMTF